MSDVIVQSPIAKPQSPGETTIHVTSDLIREPVHVRRPLPERNVMLIIPSLFDPSSMTRYFLLHRSAIR